MESEEDEAEAESEEPPPPLSEADQQCLREMRIFLRAVLREIRKDRRFLAFFRPMDAYPLRNSRKDSYYDVVRHPIDLDTLGLKIDKGEVCTWQAFQADLERLRANTELYFPVNNAKVGINFLPVVICLLYEFTFFLYV